MTMHDDDFDPIDELPADGTTITRSLPCELTAAEHEQRSKELAKLLQRARTLEAAMKADAKVRKTEIDAVKAKSQKLEAPVTTMQEDREVECRVRYALTAGTYDLIRLDTGEIAETVTMSRDEKAKVKQLEHQVIAAHTKRVNDEAKAKVAADAKARVDAGQGTLADVALATSRACESCGIVGGNHRPECKAIAAEDADEDPLGVPMTLTKAEVKPSPMCACGHTLDEHDADDDGAMLCHHNDGEADADGENSADDDCACNAFEAATNEIDPTTDPVAPPGGWHPDAERKGAADDGDDDFADECDGAPLPRGEDKFGPFVGDPDHVDDGLDAARDVAVALTNGEAVDATPSEQTLVPTKPKRGRPAGSKNKPKTVAESVEAGMKAEADAAEAFDNDPLG